jgi:hypothetical protein
MKLNAKTVHDTFLECLFKDGEPTENHKWGEAVRMKVGFNPERLKEKEPLIEELLKELPNEFQKNGGGGMSFLNMCNDKNGNQWADMHKTMDELVALGTATDKLSFLMSKEMWSELPGGMPYLVVN